MLDLFTKDNVYFHLNRGKYGYLAHSKDPINHRLLNLFGFTEFVVIVAKLWVNARAENESRILGLCFEWKNHNVR